MTYKVVILIKAEEDIKTAAAYYYQIQPKLSRKFIGEIRKKKKHLSKYPYASSIRYGKSIIIPIEIFPYGLQIVIIENIKTVVILSAICFYQSPDNWAE
jgi:plasmid stabilization system protein ParE